MIIKKNRSESLELLYDKCYQQYNLIIRTSCFSKVYIFKQEDLTIEKRGEQSYLVKVIVGTSIEYFGLHEDAVNKIVKTLKSKELEG